MLVEGLELPAVEVRVVGFPRGRVLITLGVPQLQLPELVSLVCVRRRILAPPAAAEVDAPQVVLLPSSGSLILWSTLYVKDIDALDFDGQSGEGGRLDFAVRVELGPQRGDDVLDVNRLVVVVCGLPTVGCLQLRCARRH